MYEPDPHGWQMRFGRNSGEKRASQRHTDPVESSVAFIGQKHWPLLVACTGDDEYVGQDKHGLFPVKFLNCPAEHPKQRP